MSNFGEPCHVVYQVDNKDLANSIRALRALVSKEDMSGDEILARCRQQRIERLTLIDNAVSRTVWSISSDLGSIPTNHDLLQTDVVLDIANDDDTHWKYSIVAARCLRSLIRRDLPLKSGHIEYLLKTAHDSNASMVSDLISPKRNRTMLTR